MRDIMPNVAGSCVLALKRFPPKGNDRPRRKKKESDLADEQGDDETSFSEPGERGLAFPQYQQDKQRATQHGHPEERSACMEAALPTSAVMPPRRTRRARSPSAPVRFLMGWTIQTFPSASKVFTSPCSVLSLFSS